MDEYRVEKRAHFCISLDIHRNTAWSRHLFLQRLTFTICIGLDPLFRFTSKLMTAVLYSWTKCFNLSWNDSTELKEKHSRKDERIWHKRLKPDYKRNWEVNSFFILLSYSDIIAWNWRKKCSDDTKIPDKIFSVKVNLIIYIYRWF